MQISNSKLKIILNYFKSNFQRKEHTERNIYFENNFEEWLCLILGKLVVAKGIQDRNGGKVYAIKQAEDKQYEDLCESLDFNAFFLEKNVTWLHRFRANIYALLFCCFENTGDNLLELRYKGTHIGDLVYDYLIRVSKQRIFTLEKIETKEQFKLLTEGYLYAIFFDELFKKNKPDYFVAGDIIYLNGIIVRTALKYQAKIVEFCTGKYIYELEQRARADYEPNYHKCCVGRIEDYRRTKLEEDWREKAEKRLEALFQGIGDWNTKEAYFNKRTVSREEILNTLNINNKKKNIIIMAHCFSDSPHCGGKFIYRDYYHWLCETLRIVKSLDNVNWILKAHPCRKQYGEEGIVEKLFAENKSNNLVWMPDEYSSQMIPVIADAIITVGGTGGVEYSCCGIPAIIVGRPFYSFYGFTINVKSVEHYKAVLEKAHRIRKLNTKQIEKAKEILHIYSQITKFSEDSLQKLFNEIYYEYRKNRNTMENNNWLADALIEWTEQESLLNSEIYRKGYDAGM